MNKPIALEIAQITKDGGTQSRAELSKATIKTYCEIYQSQNDFLNDGKELPPITVYYDGMKYWLADGFHREKAANEAGKTTIMANVIQGTQRDAILYSVGANATHGLPRTQEDKYRAVKTILNDSEWKQWSDREIARVCKVSHPFVSKIRKEDSEGTGNVTSKTYKRDGKTQTMNTENIGKSKTEALSTKEPDTFTKENKDGSIDYFYGEINKQTHPKLAEQFDQDVELPSYNVISEKGKILDLRNREDVIEVLAESELKSTKEKLSKVEQELQQVKDENGLLKLNTRVLTEKQLNYDEEKLKQFNAELQLINITRQLAEIIEFNPHSKHTQGSPITWENIIEKLKEINETRNQQAKKISKLIEKNKNLEHQVSVLSEENGNLKEANSKLKLTVKPNISKQAEEMLNSIQSIIESALEKGKEKREGIRIGRTNSIELLTAIKQARGVE